jgi:hypothetical protein
MKFWKKSNDQILNRVNKDIKRLVESKEGLTLLFLCSTDEGGQSIVNGNAGEILKSLIRTANENSLFKKMLRDVGEYLERKESREDQDDKVMTGTKIVSVEDMSDSMIDDMVKKILNSKDDEGES